MNTWTLSRHWSLSFTHKLSRVSKSLTALFGMRHLAYGTNFLHLDLRVPCHILDFRARLPVVWGSNPGGEKEIFT